MTTMTTTVEHCGNLTPHPNHARRAGLICYGTTGSGRPATTADPMRPIAPLADDTNTLRAATRQEVADWLTENRFADEGEHAEGFGMYTTHWYRLGSVRVTDDDGTFTVYVFDPREQRRGEVGSLRWQSKITWAPLGVITALITSALDYVAAAMLPTD